MPPESGQSPHLVSLFNVQHNWDHLTSRPCFQQPVVDGVRAIAVLWVVLLHMFFFHSGVFPEQVSHVFTNPATSWIYNGDLGVDLFFVISGFLIGSILFREFKDSGGIFFQRFYVRRFLRLIPVYLVVMLMGLYFLHGMPGLPKWNYAHNAWANILYINNFLPMAKQYMGWCWSLAIEEQFYLLFPAFILLFMFVGKGRVRFLIGLMGLSVVIRFAVIHVTGIAPPYRAAVGTPRWNAFVDTIYDKPWMRFGGAAGRSNGGLPRYLFRP